MVEYDSDFDSVEVVKYAKQDGRHYEVETIDSETVPSEEIGDKDCAEIAVRLMDKYS